MVLHGIYGVMLGILGYEIISAFINSEKGRIPVSPFFISIWVVCFALAIGAMWEIWEYMADGIFGLNTQEYLTSSGTFDKSTPLQGRNALTDTMEDIILDFLGAAIIGVTCYIEWRHKSTPISSAANSTNQVRSRHHRFQDHLPGRCSDRQSY